MEDNSSLDSWRIVAKHIGDRVIRSLLDRLMRYGVNMDSYIWNDESNGYSSLIIGTPINQGRKVFVLYCKHGWPGFVDSFPNGKDWNPFCHETTARAAKEELDSSLKEQEDEYNAKIQEDNIQEANREFNEMMDDFEAWSNID